VVPRCKERICDYGLRRLVWSLRYRCAAFVFEPHARLTARARGTVRLYRGSR